MEVPGDPPMDTASEISTISSDTVTDIWDGQVYAVPWPGNTYIIIEKSSGRAITTSNSKVTLEPFGESSHPDNQWLCIEKNGFFAFQNPTSGKYLGHNGNQRIVAAAGASEWWENMITRRHPDGGYQLLVPYWWYSLRLVVVSEDGSGLETRQHGTTVWEFVKIPSLGSV